MMANIGSSKEDESIGDDPSPLAMGGGMLSTVRGNEKGGCQHVMDTGRNEIVSRNEQETTEDVALLLTSMAEIASKEVPASIGLANQTPPPTDAPRYATPTWQESENDPVQKARTVSISSPGLVAQYSPEYNVGNYTIGDSTSITPPQSPSLATARPRTISDSSVECVYGHSPRLAHSRYLLQPQIGRRPKQPASRVLHKKFSWRNYPELEEFLIANRKEYLRHSTLNYTVQQKQFNNKLTERMLELAAECGYVFDEHDFSFVTVRDRIRCYYKSYVQSLKKRGVIIGYAARKAGLVTERDLEQSACVKGKISMPHHETMAA